MAKMVLNAGFAGASGRVGNAVLVQTEGGVVLRERPGYVPSRTGKQVEVGGRLARINRAWDALDAEQAEAWRAFGRGEGRKGYSAFVALGSKYLHLHGGYAVPTDPPGEPFLGDLVRVLPVAVAGGVRFDADRASAPGAVAELLAQALSGPNNAAKKDGYRSLGFATFAPGAMGARFDLPPGPHALAYRFVEAATGRMTGLLPLGRIVAVGG